MKIINSLFAIALCLIVCFSSTSAQQNQMRIGGEVSLALPTGDMGDASSTGFGLTGVFSYSLNPQLLLTGSIGYITFGEKIAGFSFSTVPVNAGIQYRFNQDPKFQPYIGAETLLFFNSAKVNTGFFGSVSTSSTDFGFTPIVGAAFPLNANVEIRANLKYHMIFTSGSTSSFVGIGGGVHFRI
ncbi:MAG TPA: outer membrane beta-barrel protein [Candidatus Kapabacteria bacterium]|nr:outer membrane beta-barrel protein [Candidatus Kapabacteria bacterium]